MFDLERAVREWKKGLAGKPALDETYILELEAVLRDEVADLVRRGHSEEEAFRRVRAGMGEDSAIGSEFSKVRGPQRRGHRLRRLLLPDLLGNYIRISLRKIRRQKGYSFINIAGLAVGLACCILMMLWVRDELSFDRFHANRDSIYRLITERKTENGLLLDARTPTPLGPALKAGIPEVVNYSRYQAIETYGIRLGDKAVFDDIVGVADPSFFTMFSFAFVIGDPKTALAGPRSIVVTERLARKYFGGDNPMGKVLELTSLRDPYTVTGVIRDVPENSHLHFDCMIPSANMTRYHHVNFDNWASMFFYV
ncbi:MAG: ABC transporter permease [Acidobacteriota bacterium]